MNHYVGVDLGTTAIKVVLFDENGNELKSASRELTLKYPGANCVEQNTDAWYEIPCELIREVCRDIAKDSVRGISVSSQGITVIPTDENYIPLCDGISWLDSRATEELEFVLSKISDKELFEITGKHPSPLYSLPKLLWLKNHRREIFDSAKKFLMPMDYFTARTCGVPATDATMAGGTMLYDLKSFSWSEKICGLFGIDTEKLPVVLPTAVPAGKMNSETQKLTDLNGDISVAVGAQDQKIAAYGAGIEKGTVTMSLGTAGAMEMLCDNGSELLPSFAFNVSGETSYVLEGCINTFGAAIKWARDNVFPDLSYKDMDKLAEMAPAGCDGIRFYPHLSGPSTPHFYKIPASGWKNLSLSTTRAKMIRSLYEGLACEIRMNIEEAEKAGVEVRFIKLFGGTSKSDIVCRIIADITGKTVLALRFTEIASYGAAKAAAACCGNNSFGGHSEVKTYYPENDSEKIYSDYCTGQIY